MTRFARAKGSKSSNKRVPEDATPWQVIKQELEQKKRNQNEDSSHEARKNLVKENSGKIENDTPQWADFSDDEKSKKAGVKKVNLFKKKRRNKKMLEKIETTVEASENIQKLPSKKSKKKHDKQLDNSNLKENKETDDIYVLSEETGKKTKKNSKYTQSISDNNTNAVDSNSKNVTIKVVKNKKVNKEFHNRKINQQKGNKIKNGNHQRRKPKTEEFKIGGKNILLMYVDGFPVKKEDGERLLQLRKDMISKGIPKSEIEKAMKLERRRAEKALAREKKKRCFNCRGIGHVLSECPNVSQEAVDSTTSGICFKCGSTEHTHFECKVVRDDAYKFAQCFICKEQGHIARQCPDNAKGLYPRGGACKVCGDVTHLKKDCPTYIAQQEDNKVLADTIDNTNIESIEGTTENNKKIINNKVKKQKVVKF